MRLWALQSAADNNKSPAPLSWDALRNMGIPVGYDEFAARWDSPQEGELLKKLVDRFDSHGLYVKTHQEAENPNISNKAPSDNLASAAKRAAQHGLSQKLG